MIFTSLRLVLQSLQARSRVQIAELAREEALCSHRLLDLPALMQLNDLPKPIDLNQPPWPASLLQLS